MYKVLLVDDCRADVMGISENLDWKKLDCEIVAVAYNGQEGVEKALEYKPDIIITDVSMPILSGIEMTKILRAKMDNIFFVFISCFDEFSYIKSAMDEDAVAYILKPIKIEELVKAVEKVVKKLEEKKQYNELQISLNPQASSLMNDFFAEALLNSKFDKEYAAYLGISDEDIFNMAIIRVDDSLYSFSKAYDVLNTMKSLISELLHDNKFCLLDFGIDMLVVLSWDKEIEIADYNLILENIKSEIANEYGYVFNVTVNMSHCKFTDLSNQFSSLQSSANTDRNISENVSSRDLYVGLTNVLFGEDYEEIRLFVDKLIVEYNLKNINHLRALCIQIINVVITILTEYNGKFSEIIGDEFVVWNRLLSINSIGDINKWLDDTLFKTREYLVSQTKNIDRYEALVGKVRNYIDEHYFSYTVIDEIAEQLQLSAGYINLIFKKHIGQTLFSYTVNKRMKKAKELLSDESISITKISQMVGYSSNAYFATAFKKTTGMSPKKYRNHILGIR